MDIEKIFDEIIDEAYDGITYDGIFLKFHTLDKVTLSGTFNDVPILVIKNKKELVNKLKTYVYTVLDYKRLDITKSNIKKIISLLWANACYEDFSRPNNYIDNHINFYINDDFLNKDKEINNIVIKKRAESIYKETPYAFKSYMRIGEDKYYLPYINYGISNDTCYIYNIVDSKNDGKHKDIEEIYNTKLLSLSLFMKELYNYGIGRVKVVSCLPMRENKNSIVDYFIDMEHIFKNIIISSRPFECDEYMNINISEFDKKNKVNFNELIFDKE